MKEKTVLRIENPDEMVDPEVLTAFPYAFLKKNSLLPVRDAEGNILILTDNLLKIDIGEIREILQEDVKAALSSEEAIQRCLEKYYYHPSSSKKVIDDLSSDEIVQIDDEIDLTNTNLLDLANKAPVIRLVNQVFYRALSMRASDIHIQAGETELKIRYRVDGILHDIFVLPRRYHAALVTRIKIISNLDIAEKRVPQDGRTTIKIENKKIDVRISIIPTFFGESVVLRLLDKANLFLSLEELGFSKENYEIFGRLIGFDHGIILLTGPTGSGKTTTLYAALSRINSPGVNIITLEDPVEYNVEGVNQIQVNPKVGLTFANGLRSILRHDPNVIMVGEIRDVETAEMAIQASLTGHLVFSTLHTNDSTNAIVRLIDMGVEPYLISSSLIGVMAQRLVRLNCPDCSIEVSPPRDIMKQNIFNGEGLNDISYVEGQGCNKCFNEGYYGRTVISELLSIDEEIKEMILHSRSASDIKKASVRKGLKTLRMDGVRQIRRGLTTFAEVLRVTQEV